MYAYLQKTNPEKNQHRFYALAVQPTLFGEWALVRNWGRVGANGTQRSDWFDTEDEAIQAFEVMKQQKEKRGYC